MLDIITVTYNSSRVFPEFLESLKFIDRRFILTVVSNWSPIPHEEDKLMDMLSASKYRFQFIGLSQNLFWSAATNIGIAHTIGGNIMLVNPDVRFKKGAYRAMDDCLLDFDIVSPKMMQKDGSIAFVGGGVNTGGSPEYFNIAEEEDDKGQFDHRHESFWNTGACMLFDRPVYEDNGPFKEDGMYLHYNSDREWCMRAAKKGYKIGVGGKKTEIIHLLGGSSV